MSDVAFLATGLIAFVFLYFLMAGLWRI